MRDMYRRSCVILILFATLLFGAGCQTFRTSQSDIDRIQDREAAEVVAAIGTCLYYIAQAVSCFR